jgi:hypothetical protein
MQSVPHNIAVVERAGYQLLTTFTLPRQAWVDGYYDFLRHARKHCWITKTPQIEFLPSQTVREIEFFQCAEGSYGMHSTCLNVLHKPKNALPTANNSVGGGRT